MYKIFFLISCIFFLKCSQEIPTIAKEWQNKTIQFPQKIVFNLFGKDTLLNYDNSKYRILNYIDTNGCTSCKLLLPQWKSFIKTIDSLSDKNIAILFIFNSNKYKYISYLLKSDNFNTPVCFDYNDSLNIINHFPKDYRFQTFLLDNKNRVKIIGNPIHNPKIRELYLKVITGDTTNNIIKKTTIKIPQTTVNLKQFLINHSPKAVFSLKNTGEIPLIIKDISTSCGCTSVTYEKRPIKKEETLNITVTIQLNETGFFEKTIWIHCNAENSPIPLTIKGTVVNNN